MMDGRIDTVKTEFRPDLQAVEKATCDLNEAIRAGRPDTELFILAGHLTRSVFTNVQHESHLYHTESRSITSTKTVLFQHAIGDTVEVVHVKGITGVVTVLRASERGNYYLVVWWQDGRRFEEWLAEFEIKEVKP